MTRRAVVVLVALVCAVPRAAGAQTPPPAPAPPTVVARGDGEVRAVPDMAILVIGAEQLAKTPKEAQAAVAAAMTAVQQRLTGAGVPKDAIRTTAYDVQAQFDYGNGRQTLRGYMARHAIDVRVDDVSRVGALLEVAIAAGGTSVQGVRFDLKQREALEREALTKAVANARARAEAMAAGAGTAIAAVVRIEEAGAAQGPEPVMMRMAAAPMAADAAPPVAPGETVIRASVTLTARLK
ncbi:MAG: SIMPL domain-containing protein [Vicinamibacterales bacterium]